MVEDGKDGWLFNFDEHAGKVDELAGFVTTCAPRPTLLGDGQFVAFGCHGLSAALDLAGFNMKGEQMWQENFYRCAGVPDIGVCSRGGAIRFGAGAGEWRSSTRMRR